MKNLIRQFSVDESGAAAIEYALLTSLIAVATIGATMWLGAKISAVMTQIAGNLN